MRFLARIANHLLPVSVGILIFGWGGCFFGRFLSDLPVERTALGITTGRVYSKSSLLSLLEFIQRIERRDGCDAARLRSASIIRLRLLEISIEEAERNNIEGNSSILRKDIERTLGCSPSDAFLWFILYWLDGTQNGFSDRSISLLERSYQFGRNEAWISQSRNAYGLAVIERLPASLSNSVIAEFASLLEAGFIDQAAANFDGPGAPIQQLLLANISGVRDDYKRDFAKRLRTRGLDVIVPGVEMPERRPWN